MTINWNKDEDNKAISLLMKSPGTKVAIHFEDNLDESTWTFASGLDGIWAGNLPKEFIAALREHLEKRK